MSRTGGTRMVSRSLLRAASRSWFLALSLSVVGACSESEPVTLANLLITATGEYTLDGRPVASDQLTGRLKELQASKPKVHLAIVASSRASYRSVGTAIQAAQDAGVLQVTFASSE